MHATAFLKDPHKPALGAMVVLHGAEQHLKHEVLKGLTRRVLGSIEESLGVTRFPGKGTEFAQVRDELLTVSMFTPAKLVVVEDADDFITAVRPQLEQLAEKPIKKSVLVLLVKSWRKNTKLAKKLETAGLEVECAELTGVKLTQWLTDLARDEYDKQLTKDAAALIPELAGSSLAQLAQELQKLAAYVGDGARIGVEDVRKLVGGWKAETTWTMVNAIRDGAPDTALTCLEKLLNAGEAPQKILGGMNFVFKKLAMATEQSRTGIPLRQAMESAGIFKWEFDAVERYLRRIQRPRAERILERLVMADYGLKGGSRIPERLQLEQLILWLAGSWPLS